MGRCASGASDAAQIQPLPSDRSDHMRCTGRDADAAGLPLHLSNCWSLSDRRKPLYELRCLACAPKHGDFGCGSRTAALGARQADQQLNRAASGHGRVHGVAPWAGAACYAAVRSDQALLPSAHLQMLWNGRDWPVPLTRRKFSCCRAIAATMCGAVAVKRMRLACDCT